MRCGRRLRTRYQGTGGRYASYVCEGQRPDALARRACCVSLSAAAADPVVERRALARLEPAQVQLAAQAWAEVERRQAAQDRQWQLRVEAARYDADLARQRYEEADPKRRLVADSLEQAWEDALARLREAEAQRAAHQPGAAPGARRRAEAPADGLGRGPAAALVRPVHAGEGQEADPAPAHQGRLRGAGHLAGGQGRSARSLARRQS